VAWAVTGELIREEKWAKPEEEVDRGKEKGKEKKKEQRKEKKKERKVKWRRIKLGISKLENYGEKNKTVFHEIGLKGIYKQRKIKSLNTKDFQSELKNIFIKRRLHLFLIKMNEQRLQL
jgi:hypothetical protein